MEKLEKKFQEPTRTVEKDDDLQGEWKSMESRVTNRVPLTKEELGGRTGRMNIRKTDEDVWLKEGLYDGDDNSEKE